MDPSRSPVPVRRSAPPVRRSVSPALVAAARRLAPTVAVTGGALVASLAAERAFARLVTVALGRAVASTPFAVVQPGLQRPASPAGQRTVVTETTTIERISRRR